MKRERSNCHDIAISLIIEGNCGGMRWCEKSEKVKELLVKKVAYLLCATWNISGNTVNRYHKGQHLTNVQQA